MKATLLPYRTKRFSRTTPASHGDWLVIQLALGVSDPNQNREPIEIEFQPEEKGAIEQLCRKYNCQLHVRE